jgi:hypothetical protein
LLSSTFKVGENKVALFFSFEAQVKSYRLFVVFSHFLENKTKMGYKKRHFYKAKSDF